MEKTNVMRILEQHGISYTPHTYPHGQDAVDGIQVAKLLGQDPECVYKTLVARGKSGDYFVFDIPVAEELDLKKAAKAVGEKSVALIHVKELLPLTGYTFPRSFMKLQRACLPLWYLPEKSAGKLSVTQQNCSRSSAPPQRTLSKRRQEITYISISCKNR